MPKIDVAAIPPINRTGYPPPFDAPGRERPYRRPAPAGGLTDLGVTQVRLKPQAWSSHRHWHAGEDEFLVMIGGEAVLVDDDGETAMHAVDCILVVVGGGLPMGGDYPDIDLAFTADNRYVHDDGSEYGTQRV